MPTWALPTSRPPTSFRPTESATVSRPRGEPSSPGPPSISPPVSLSPSPPWSPSIRFPAPPAPPGQPVRSPSAPRMRQPFPSTRTSFAAPLGAHTADRTRLRIGHSRPKSRDSRHTRPDVIRRLSRSFLARTATEMVEHSIFPGDGKPPLRVMAVRCGRPVTHRQVRHGPHASMRHGIRTQPWCPSPTEAVSGDPASSASLSSK